MACAGHCGVDIALDDLSGDAASALFNEELGFVVQLRADDAPRIVAALREDGIGAHDLGVVTAADRLRFTHDGKTVLEASRSEWHRSCAETRHRVAQPREHPARQHDEIADT